MKKLLLLSALLGTTLFIFSQNQFHAFLNSVNNIEDSAARVAFVEEYMTYVENETTPLVEGDTATFIYYAEADSVNIAGDFTGWNPTLIKCDKVNMTHFFYSRQIFEPTARLDYKLVVNGGSWIVDPLNPNQVTGGYGPNSELAMSAYVQPWEIQEYDGVEQGTIENFTIASEEFGRNFNVNVYLPPNYDKLSNLSVAYVHDGSEYISLGSMDNVINNLLDSNKIDPLIGVFITPNNRMNEYGFDDRYKYATFVVETVVPYIDANYKTNASKNHRLTMGTSLGGNISGLISYTYPDVFANSGWHSPAFWVNDGEVELLYIETSKPIKIYFTVGTYEDLGVDWDVFANSLQTLGYEYSWAKYHEGHSWGQWRATIDDMLTFFYPKGSTMLDVEKDVTKQILGQNYPNPFYKTTTIPIFADGEVLLTVFNIIGQPVFEKQLFVKNRSRHYILNTEDFAEGVYYYTLKSGNKTFTRKMVKE